MKMFIFTLLVYFCDILASSDSTNATVVASTSLLNANPWTVLSWGTTIVAVLGTVASIWVNRSKSNKGDSESRESISEMINRIITKRVDKVDNKLDHETEKMRDVYDGKVSDIHERIDGVFSDISENKEHIASLTAVLSELKEHSTKHNEQHRKDVKDIYKAFDSWREESKEENNEIKQLIIKTLYLDDK